MLLAECTILLLPLDVVRCCCKAAVSQGLLWAELHNQSAMGEHSAAKLSVPHFQCPTSRLQGNRSGLVGCGFWNDGCGGLNLALVWQVAYAIIFGLIVVVFPFMIFFYEADDEGLATEDAARAAGKDVNCLTTLCDFSGCWRAGLSAIVYTLITVVISAIVIVLMYVFLNDTEIPYKLTAVSVATVAFQPADTPISAKCPVGATNCLQPCGTGTCNWVNNTLNISVSDVRVVQVMRAA